MAMTLRAKRLNAFSCHLCGGNIITEGLQPFVPVTCAKCGQKTRVPVRLGRFLLFRVVETTPGGRVFHGHDEGLGRAVRVLILRESGSAAAERELKLAQFISRVPCQGIPRILSLEETEGQTYLVMEYTGLPTVDRMVEKQGAFAPARALTVALGAARVLRHASSVGLAHMAMVPVNLLVGPEDETWVRGFSPLNFAETAPEGGWCTTSSPWAAPETLTGIDKPGALQDMWSLGALLEFMLAGRPPTSDGLTLKEAGLPAPAVAAVERLCAKRPEGRFSAWDEAVAFLSSAIEDLVRPSAPTEHSMPQVVEPGPIRIQDRPVHVPDAAMEGSSSINIDPLDAAIVDFAAAASAVAPDPEMAEEEVLPPMAPTLPGDAPMDEAQAETPEENLEDALAKTPADSSAEMPKLPTDAEDDDFAMDFGALLSKNAATDVELPGEEAAGDVVPEAKAEAAPEEVAEEVAEEPAEELAEEVAEEVAEEFAEEIGEELVEEAEEPAFDFDSALDSEPTPAAAEAPAEAPVERAITAENEQDEGFETLDDEPVAEETAEEATEETVAEAAASPVAEVAPPASQKTVSAAPAEQPAAAPAFENEPPPESGAASKLGLAEGISADQMAKLRGLKKKPAAAPAAEAPKAEPQAQVAPTPSAAPVPDLSAATPTFENEPPPESGAASKLGLASGISSDQMSRLKGFKKKPAVEAAAAPSAPAPAAPQAAASAELPAVTPSFENEPPPESGAASKLGLASGISGDQMSRLKGFKKKPAIEAAPAAPAAPAPAAPQAAASAELPAATPSFENEPPADSGAASKLGLASGISSDQMSRLKGFKKKPATEAAPAAPVSALPITPATHSSRPANIAPEPQAPEAQQGAQKNRMQAALAKLKSGAGGGFAVTPKPAATPQSEESSAAPEAEAPATLPEISLPMETPAESGDVKKLGLAGGISADQMAKLRGLKKKP